MKILHLIYDDVSNPWLGGGGAFQTLTNNKALVSRGHQVTVVTGSYPQAKKERERGGVLYRSIGCGKNYELSRLSYALSALRAIRNCPHDILIDDFSAYSPTLAPWLTKKPVVAIVRSFLGAHAFKRHGPLGMALFLSERAGLRRYRHLVANSPYIETTLKGIVPAGRIELIYDGVEEPLFSLNPTEGDYILYLGRIDIYPKGLDVLVKALEQVSRSRSPLVKLLIAGGGKDQDVKRLNQLISEYHLGHIVKIAGRVTRPKVGELLSGCLFVCMPSRFESLGNVAMEAAACGKAVIGTGIPALQAVVKHGETGLLVKPDDSEELAEAITTLLHDGELRQRLGKAGRDWIRNFSSDKTVQALESFYLECLQARPQ